MSENRTSGGSNTGTGSTGTGAGGYGGTSAGSTGGSSTSGSGQGLTPSTTGTGGGAGAGTATGLAATAQEYGQKIAGAASTAKDYVTDKVSVVSDKIGDKITDLRNKDFSEVANDAKEYARQNPGQAILISAAAGLVLGLLIRGSRR